MALPNFPENIETLEILVAENFQHAKAERQRAELYEFPLGNLKCQHFGQSSEKCTDQPEQQLLCELPARPPHAA